MCSTCDVEIAEMRRDEAEKYLIYNDTIRFNDYQEQATSTAVYPDKGGELGLAYVALGVGNEAGEVQGKVKKYLRGDYDLETLKEVVASEISDVLWYLAALATELDLSLGALAVGNLEKLADRAARGVIKGNGDER